MLIGSILAIIVLSLSGILAYRLAGNNDRNDRLRRHEPPNTLTVQARHQAGLSLSLHLLLAFAVFDGGLSIGLSMRWCTGV